MDVLKIPLLENCTTLFNFDDCVYKIKFLYQIKRERLNEKIYSETLANIQICFVLQELLKEIKSTKNIKNIQTEYFMVQTEIQDWFLGSKLEFKLFRTFMKCGCKVIVLTFQIKDFLLKREKKIDQMIPALDTNAYVTPITHYKANTSYDNLVANRDILRTELTPYDNDNKIKAHSVQSSEIEHVQILLLATPKLGAENYRSLNLKKQSTIAEIVQKHDVMIDRDKVPSVKSTSRKQKLSADKFFRMVCGSEQKALNILSHQHPKEKNNTACKTNHYQILDYTCQMDTDRKKKAHTTSDDFQCSKHNSSKAFRKVDISFLSTLPNINLKAKQPANNRQQELLQIFHKNEFEKSFQSLPLGNIKSCAPQENKCTENIKKNDSKIKYQSFVKSKPKIFFNELKNFSVPDFFLQQRFTADDHLQHGKNYFENVGSKLSKCGQDSGNFDVIFDKKLLKNQEYQKKSTVSDLPEYLPQRKRKGTIYFNKLGEKTSSEKCEQNKMQKISLLQDFSNFSNICKSEIARTKSYLQKNKRVNKTSLNQHSLCSEHHLDFLKNGKSVCVVNANLDQSKPGFYSDDVMHTQEQEFKHHSCDLVTSSGHTNICAQKFNNYHDIQDSRNFMNSKSSVLNCLPKRLLKDDICLFGSPQIKLIDLKVSNFGSFEA